MQKNIESGSSLAKRPLSIVERLADMEASVVATHPTAHGGTWAEQYKEGWAWIRNFIMQPHADLGRKGAVCPFAKPSHRVGGLYFATLDAGGTTLESHVQLVLQLPGIYERILQKSGAPADLFSLAIFIDHLAPSDHYRYVDLTHSIVKPLFMEAGLMLGEFRPSSPVPGLHSECFRPMTSPLPCFVLRAIAVHDKLFFSKPGAVTRSHEIDCYLKWVGHKLTAPEVRRIRGLGH